MIFKSFLDKDFLNQVAEAFQLQNEEQIDKLGYQSDQENEE